MTKIIKYVATIIIVICLAVLGAIYYQRSVNQHADEAAEKAAKQIMARESKQHAARKSSENKKVSSDSASDDDSASSSTTSGDYNKTDIKSLFINSSGQQDSGFFNNSVQTAFYNWASARAKEHNNAVTDWVFDNFGTDASYGFYANTPDGKMQVMATANPNDYNKFPIHMLGGVTFFEANDGTTGGVSQATMQGPDGSFGSGYENYADLSRATYKYILGDNGVVYELDNGISGPSDGFGSFTVNYGGGNEQQNRTDNDEAPQENFVVSPDQAAQKELRAIMNQYKN